MSSDFQKRSVTSGDIIIIRPGQLHSIEQDANYVMEYENIIFKPDLLISGNADLCAAKFITPFMEGKLPSESYLTPALSWYQPASECIREIDLLCATRPEGVSACGKGAFVSVLFSAHLQPAEKRDRICLADKVSRKNENYSEICRRTLY